MRRLSALVALVMLAAGMTSPLPAPRPAPRPVAETLVPQAAVPLAIEAVPVTLSPPERGALRLLSAHVLRAVDPQFGGLSGLHIAADGETATVVGDRGSLFTLRLLREAGLVTGVAAARLTPLVDTAGRSLPQELRDAEALAAVGDGFAIAFEGDHRVWHYRANSGRAEALPSPPGVERLPPNSGMEALAADGAGVLYAMPERSGGRDRPFPVWRLEPGATAWTQGAWPRRPPHLVTGADIGPDGHLYVLERDFSLLRGWGMRLSRADLADWPALRPETLLQWQRGGIDNMEAVALWRAPDGTLRLVMLSDDNFHPLQRTLLLEFALE